MHFIGGTAPSSYPTQDSISLFIISFEMVRRGRRTSYGYHYLLGCSGDAATTIDYNYMK